MAKKKIGAYITLDGEREFRSSVTSCNKNLATMKSEMKLVEAQTAGNANSLNTLKRKHEVLSNTLEEHLKKEEAIKVGLNHAEQQYESVGKKLSEYREQLQKAQTALKEMESSSDTSAEELENQRTTVEELSKAIEKGEETYKRAGDRVQDWKKQLNNAEAQTIRNTKALNENATYMKEAESATDSCAKSIDAFGNKMDDTVEKLTKFSTILETNVKSSLIEIGKTSLSSAIQETVELQEAQKQLQASTGAATEATKEYNEQMQALYKTGAADSIDEVANAMALVKQYTNETDPTKIKELAENGLVLEDVFNMDLSESIRGIDSLMGNMGLTAQEAFDYMAKGAQNGLDKSGELADNIAEYGQLWSQAGFSAEEMFTILQNGLNSGAYNLDKVNDYVKEFGISLSDGRIEQNIDAFSVGTQDLFKQWKNGEATTKQVFQSVISDLANMENQQQALTIASNTWSALGEDNAMKVITSLNQVNTTYKNVHGTMEEIKNIKYDSVAAQWKVLGRTFQTDVMQPMLVKFLPVAQKGMKLLADNIEVVSTVSATAGTAIGTIFVVNKSKQFVKEVKEAGKTVADFGKGILELVGIRAAETAADTASTAAKGVQTAATVAQTSATTAQVAATTEATVAQTGLNTAMAANPIGLVVAGIATLVTATTLFSEGISKSKDEVSSLKDEADELSKKVEKTSEELAKSTSNIKTSLGEVAASGNVAESLVKELEGLANQSQKTAEEQSRMQNIVMQLNTMFPEMGLKIDEVSGKLNMSSAEMKGFINSAIEMQKIQAVQEKMAESVEKLVEAEIEAAEAGNKVGDINSKLKNIEEKRIEINEAVTKKSEEAREAQERYSEALREGADNVNELYAATQNQTEATIEYGGKTLTVTEALERMAQDENELKVAKEEYVETQEKANDAVAKANEQMEPYMEYLNGMTEATDRSTESIAKNTEEKTKASEQSMASIEVAGQELEAYNNLSISQQELAANVTNAVLTMQENVQGALESQMNMFEQFDGGVQISTETLLSNMQSQVDGVLQWEQNLSSLADKGINQGILQKLAEMGPQGSGYVNAFNNMTSAEIAKANELWGQSINIKGMTNEWGQELLDSGARNIAGGMKGLEPLMRASGANTVQGLVNGMRTAQKTSEAAGKDLGVKTIESIDQGLGVRSPSRKTMESGKNVNLGLNMGMNQNKMMVQMTAKSVADSVTKTIGNNLSHQTFKSYGTRVPQGLAQGILSGRSQVIQAATRVARDSIVAAKSALGINSPSKKFKEIGKCSMEGYLVGVQEETSKVRKSVANSLDFGTMQGKIDKRYGSTETRENKRLAIELGRVLEKIKFSAYFNGREVTRALSDVGVMFRAEV